MAELTPRMKELVQPYLAGIEPYDPNFTPTRINLSANENTYPVPAGVREAVDAALAATPLNRYPDPMSCDLRDELAAWHGVTRENICVGNGGDELLYNYLLAFGGAGRTLLNCPPCFSEYAFFASLCTGGTSPAVFAALALTGIVPSSMQQARPSAIFLRNPPIILNLLS